jgi:hypothetical protein
VLEVRVDEPQRAREALRDLALVRRATAYGARLHVAVEPPAERAVGGDPGALREAGIEAGGIEPVPPSLEDVFLARVEATSGRDGGAIASGPSSRGAQRRSDLDARRTTRVRCRAGDRRPRP